MCNAASIHLSHVCSCEIMQAAVWDGGQWWLGNRGENFWLRAFGMMMMYVDFLEVCSAMLPQCTCNHESYCSPIQSFSLIYAVSLHGTSSLLCEIKMCACPPCLRLQKSKPCLPMRDDRGRCWCGFFVTKLMTSRHRISWRSPKQMMHSKVFDTAACRWATLK